MSQAIRRIKIFNDCIRNFMENMYDIFSMFNARLLQNHVNFLFRYEFV